MNNIVEKIKHLLNVRVSNGATEAEEKSALEKANKLMEKYSIEQWQLKAKTKNVEERLVYEGRKTLEMAILFTSIGRFFNTLPLGQKGVSEVYYYGQPDNAVLSRDFTKRVFDECRLMFYRFRCSDKYIIMRSNGHSNYSIQKSFNGGYYAKIADRLNCLMKEREMSMLKSTGQNLVVLTKEQLDNDFEEDNGYRVKNARSPRMSGTNYEAFEQGAIKAKEFRILSEIKK